MRISATIALLGTCFMADPAVAQTRASISQRDRGFIIIASQSERAVYACNYTVQVVIADHLGNKARVVRIGGSTDVIGSGANIAVVTSDLDKPIQSATLRAWQCVFKKAL